jgi:hypothetical protein
LLDPGSGIQDPGLTSQIYNTGWNPDEFHNFLVFVNVDAITYLN